MDSESRKCRQKAAKARYKKTAKGRATAARYRKTDKRKVVLARYNASEKGRACRARQIALHPDRMAARRAISNSIRDGKMFASRYFLCAYCQVPAEQYHHWHGYSTEHYLDVIPLCRKCHTAEHV
jgi:hypothetical protein